VKKKIHWGKLLQDYRILKTNWNYIFVLKKGLWNIILKTILVLSYSYPYFALYECSLGYSFFTITNFPGWQSMEMRFSLIPIKMIDPQQVASCYDRQIPCRAARQSSFRNRFTKIKIPFSLSLVCDVISFDHFLCADPPFLILCIYLIIHNWFLQHNLTHECARRSRNSLPLHQQDEKRCRVPAKHFPS
jgi:hypothetical protein